MPNQPPKQQQRETSHKGHSAKRQYTPNRLKLQVGEKWSDGITTSQIETVAAHESVLKAVVIIAIVVLCGLLIAALTVHAMFVGNEQRLGDILKVAWGGLFVAGLWAVAARNDLKALVRKGVTHVLKE